MSSPTPVCTAPLLTVPPLCTGNPQDCTEVAHLLAVGYGGRWVLLALQKNPREILWESSPVTTSFQGQASELQGTHYLLQTSMSSWG